MDRRLKIFPSRSAFDNAATTMRERNKTCKKCNTEFSTYADYETHVKQSTYTYCLHCNKTFCTDQQMQAHARTIRLPTEGPIDYERSIHDKTGFEDDPMFQELIDAEKDQIADDDNDYTNHRVINIKIRPDFTYGDLDDLLSDIYTKQKNSFKLNLSIGFALYNISTGKYKYHYCSRNSLLFDQAIPITNIRDLEKFMKKIFDLDLQNDAYLSKPSSSWTVAGLTNIQVWIYQMYDTQIGHPPVDLPSYISDSKSMISLTHNGHQRIKDNLCFFLCLALHQ